MARGNQREVSREKNLAKQAQKLKQQGKVRNGYDIKAIMMECATKSNINIILITN